MSSYHKTTKRSLLAGAATVAIAFQPQVLAAATVTTAAPATATATAVAPVTTPAATTTPVPSKNIATKPVVQTPSDVALQNKGTLTGRIVDADGKAMANSPVALLTARKKVISVVSDKTGHFEVQGLKGGVYQVASNGHQGMYRLWAPKTAPPTAAQGLNIISQPTDLVRGQNTVGQNNPFSGVGRWIAENPFMTAAAVAAAIAIPISLDDDTPPPASP